MTFPASIQLVADSFRQRVLSRDSGIAESTEFNSLSYGRFSTWAVERAEQIVKDGFEEKGDRVISGFTRPEEYTGPEAPEGTVSTLYFTSVMGLKFDSKETPGIIAVHLVRSENELRADVHTDLPLNSPHQETVQKLEDAFSSSIRRRITPGERLFASFVNRVSELAALLKE